MALYRLAINIPQITGSFLSVPVMVFGALSTWWKVMVTTTPGAKSPGY